MPIAGKIMPKKFNNIGYRCPCYKNVASIIYTTISINYAKKVFITLATGVNVLKLFSFVTEIAVNCTGMLANGKLCSTNVY